MAHLILEGFPGYRLELPDDANPQTTEWFATHLLNIARGKNEAARKAWEARQSRRDSGSR